MPSIHGLARSPKWRASHLVVLVIGTAAAPLTACSDDESCPDDYTCTPEGTGGNHGTGASTSTSSISITTDIPSECDPLESGMPVAATCGLFVNADATSGDGSQGMPYATLTEALGNNPMNLPIYVCVATAPLDEDITLTAGERLVGGVDCTTWGPSAMKTSWTSPQNTIPLTLSGTIAAHIQGFAITAQAAEGFDAATLDGNDSIALAAADAEATFIHIELLSGVGAPGGPGADYVEQAPGRQSDAASFDGNAGNGCGMPTGGPSKTNFDCPAGNVTEGGKGGNGGSPAGGDGGDGSPGLPNLGAASGGIGQDAVTWSCMLNSGNGQGGNPGSAGPSGSGGTAAASITMFMLAGVPGSDGMPGGIGQGGGGGGGRRGNGTSGCGVLIPGPSGGSGGAGGCGGFGGGGGGQGGASIALVSIGARLTLSDVTLSTAAGGAGGEGGDGQTGGNGGLGGPGGGTACVGGLGGPGGTGGSGGGGAGGASIGIAYTGPEPAIEESAINVSATAAAGGAGGNDNASSNSGPNGVTVKKQAF